MLSKDKKMKLKKYGKVTYEDNRITVYVKERLVYKYASKIFPCDVEEDKDVYFIFDDIYFPANTCISGKNANLIFRNCTFTEKIEVEKAKYIEMENNKYYFFSAGCNLVDLTANKIEIKENFENEYFAKKFDEADVNIYLLGNTINIDNSVVCSEFGGHINIMGETLLLNESVINAPHVHINADNIRARDSVIKSPKEITIDNANCNFTCTIKSPIVIYNDIRLNSLNSEIVNIDKEKVKLLEERLKLIKTLHSIEMNCIRENGIILSKVQRELKNKKVVKVLKR